MFRDISFSPALTSERKPFSQVQIKCVHLTFLQKGIISDWITSKLILSFYTAQLVLIGSHCLSRIFLSWFFFFFFFYMYKNNILIYLANKLNSHFYIQYGLLWGVRNYSRFKLFKLFKDSTTKKTSSSSVQKCR